jgi:hypothetical protein
VIERDDPVKDDTFSVVADELKNDDDDGIAEVALTGFGVEDLPNVTLVHVNET